MASKTALVRRPSPRLAEGIVTNIERQPVDVHLAAKQWDGYVEAMEDAGWEIVEVPPADDCPDGVFIEDTLVVFRNVAVSRARAPSPAGPRSSERRRRWRSSVARSTGSGPRGRSTAVTC